MNALSIRKSNFEMSKNKLKTFSNQTNTSLSLARVDSSGGFFNLFSHKVTGDELNKLTTQIQEHLRGINQLNIEIIKEFGQVYNTFDILDKDYMQSIEMSIRAIEKTNDDVKTTQTDIKKTIETQKKMLNVLSQFKERLDKLKHLEDIDNIWSDAKNLQNNITATTNNLNNVISTINIAKKDIEKLNAFKEQLNKIAPIVEKHTQSIDLLKQFKNNLDKYQHLKDIDLLWNNSNNFGKDINSLGDILNQITPMVEAHAQSINLLKQFKIDLEKYQHLKDIDLLWNDSNNFRKDIKSLGDILNTTTPLVEQHEQLMDSFIIFKNKLDSYEHLKDIDLLWSEVQRNDIDIKDININLGTVESKIDNNTVSIDSLTQFREKLQNYKHLEDIDWLWSESERYDSDINVINNRLEYSSTRIQNNIDSINLLSQFKDELASFEHLDDVDWLWNESERLNTDIKGINKSLEATNDKIETNKTSIGLLTQFKAKLESYEHLNDIDVLWSNTEAFNSGISKKLENSNIQIETNKTTIDLLTQFKTKLESYEHINDIDVLWNNTEVFKSDINKSLESTNGKIETNKTAIDSLTQFKDKLNGYEHLNDIDILWGKSEGFNDDIAGINQRLETCDTGIKDNKASIDSLTQFKVKLNSYEHINDIDVLWNNTEVFKSDINNRLKDSNEKIETNKTVIGSLTQFKDKLNSYEHLAHVDETYNRCVDVENGLSASNETISAQQVQLESLKKCLEEVQSQNVERQTMFTKRLKLAYVLAGSSIGIVIVETVLMLLRIL